MHDDLKKQRERGRFSSHDKASVWRVQGYAVPSEANEPLHYLMCPTLRTALGYNVIQQYIAMGEAVVSRTQV